LSGLTGERYASTAERVSVSLRWAGECGSRRGELGGLGVGGEEEGGSLPWLRILCVCDFRVALMAGGLVGLGCGGGESCLDVMVIMDGAPGCEADV
jgi:hypothetical protein